jgi:Cys-tRNA(Pro)/Cys-tRNA(Cys) deacylase
MITNNVTRLLDSRKIQYKSYELPREKLGAVETAKILGVDAKLVYKTIVVKRTGKGKPILAVIPGPCEVDLKALAKSVGEKKLVLPTEREAENLTNLKAGGISPLALINKGFQVIIDQSVLVNQTIFISGGQRGLSIRIPVQDLVQLTDAELNSIVEATTTPETGSLK